MSGGVANSRCPRCGAAFRCGMAGGDARCWCAGLPPVAGLPVPAPGTEAGCLCPHCLAAAAGSNREDAA